MFKSIKSKSPNPARTGSWIIKDNLFNHRIISSVSEKPYLTINGNIMVNTAEAVLKFYNQEFWYGNDLSIKDKINIPLNLALCIIYVSEYFKFEIKEMLYLQNKYISDVLPSWLCEHRDNYIKKLKLIK